MFFVVCNSINSMRITMRITMRISSVARARTRRIMMRNSMRITMNHDEKLDEKLDENHHENQFGSKGKDSENKNMIRTSRTSRDDKLFLLSKHRSITQWPLMLESSILYIFGVPWSQQSIGAIRSRLVRLAAASAASTCKSYTLLHKVGGFRKLSPSSSLKYSVLFMYGLCFSH